MKNKAQKRARRELLYMIGILVVIILLITAGAMLFYTRQSSALAEEQKQDLSAIADLKSSLIESWYQERINNAWGIADSRSFAEATARWFENPKDVKLKEAAASRLGSLLRYNQYEAILLLKPDGTVMMAINDTSKHSGPRVTGFITQALGSGRVLTSDLYYCPEAKRPHMDFVAPIIYKDKRTGALILRVNPSRFFYPLIQNWPTPSRTSETLLVRLEGDSVLFLNNVRHRENTALKMKEPLTNTKLPAVMAVTGRTGTVEGYDYRGKPVLAALRRISGTSWFMVSKVDADEVYAPLKRLFVAVALLAFLLAGVAAGAVGIVWYRRRNQYLESLMSVESQLKEANIKLLESNQELEATVEELTASEQQLKAAEEELQQQYKELQKSEKRFRSTLDNMLEGCQIIGSDWRYLYINEAAERHNRRPNGELLGNKYSDMWPGIEKTNVYAVIKDTLENRVVHLIENEFIFPDGQRGWFELGIHPLPEGVFILSVDITDRKRAEIEQQLTVDVLRILNRPESTEDIISEILNIIRPITGCEAIAVRLKDNGDYPYFVTQGFPEHFVEKERSLCSRDNRGEVLVGQDGNPFLECMCGNIIAGRVDVSKPFFTPGGSFWSNNTSDLLAQTTDVDRQTHTRNFCNMMGYQSVALIPLKSDNEIIGLMQMNDHSPNIFTLNLINYLEGIGASIGIALKRKRHEEEIQAQKEQLLANNEELMAAEQELRAAEEELHQQLDDLTRNQEELFQSKQQFQLLADSAPDAIFIQIDGKYAYVNQACLSLYGAERTEQLIGRPVIERIHPDFQEMVKERVRLLNREKTDVPTVEYRHLKLDGTPVDVEVSAVPFEYKGDNGALVFMRDITERRKIEQELRQAQKIEAIGLLAGGVAHDFNNMLAGIIGNVELLAMKLSGDKALSSYVNNIANAADHAATLTKQLLTFARKGRMVWQPTDIHNLINDTCGILEKTIDRRIMITRQLDAVMPVVNGDPSQLENVLLNLGVNARDAMPEGGLLTFSTREEVLDSNFIKNHGYQIEPGKYLLISISDTGVGMDSNTLKHIFEPFFTTKDPGKGTGLGLASVYGTIMNHKGAIEVKSEPGKGAIFNIWLPSATNAAPEKKAAGPLTEDLTGQGRILLVDDEEMIREMAQNLLKHLGYDVCTCCDGAEAVGFYGEHQNEIDLVIMDMIMPVMNGMDAFIKLKNINPKVKVLISSGFSAGRESNELFKLGLKGYISKPYHLADLAAKIKKVMEES